MEALVANLLEPGETIIVGNNGAQATAVDATRSSHPAVLCPRSLHPFTSQLMSHGTPCLKALAMQPGSSVA